MSRKQDMPSASYYSPVVTGMGENSFPKGGGEGSDTLRGGFAAWAIQRLHFRRWSLYRPE